MFLNFGLMEGLPKLTGTGGQLACHEIHIFLGPVNPSMETVKVYEALVKCWNDTHASTTDKMKACFLGLVFRGSDGKESVVSVMQSAR